MDLERLESDLNTHGVKEYLRLNNSNVDVIYKACTVEKLILDELLVSYATDGHEYLHSKLTDGRYKAQMKLN